MSDTDLNPHGSEIDSRTDSDAGQHSWLERRASWVDLRAAMEVLLRETGSLSMDEFVARLGEGDADLGAHFRDDPDDAVMCVMEDDMLPALLVHDDRCIYLPSLVAGRLFTHRVTDLEIEHDLLATDPDLVPIRLLADYPGYGTTVAGDRVQVFYAGDQIDAAMRPIPEAAAELSWLVLPVGTISGLGVRTGDLVAVSYSTAGLEIIPIEGIAEPNEAARDYARSYVSGGVPAETDYFLAELLADVPNALAEPGPPISELFASWGISEYGVEVAEAGFDWDGWHRRLDVDGMVERYQISTEEAEAIRVLLRYAHSFHQLLEVFQDDAIEHGADPRALTREQSEASFDRVAASNWSAVLPSSEEVDDALAKFEEPYLSRVLVEELVETELESPWAGLGSAAENLRTNASRRVRPALHWLQATAYDRLGDLAAAEQHLRAAERLDQDFYPALLDLARLALDRGDLPTGRALMSRVPEGVGAHLAPLLEPLQPEPARNLPRNAPCWCGSGRKFKQCHLRQSGEPALAERVARLYSKATVYAIESGWESLITSLSYLQTAGERPGTAGQAGDDGLVYDVTLFEGGALETYVDSRQPVLPADELTLARRWLQTPRSAYEVTEVKPDEFVLLRDTQTSQLVPLAQPHLPLRDLEVGELVCGHLLPWPDGYRAVHLSGSLDPDRHRALAELLDTEGTGPIEVVALLANYPLPEQLRTEQKT